MATKWKTGYKQEKVSATVTPAEKTQVAEKASAAGLTEAQYIRVLLGLSKDLPKGRRPKKVQDGD